MPAGGELHKQPCYLGHVKPRLLSSALWEKTSLGFPWVSTAPSFKTISLSETLAASSMLWVTNKNGRARAFPEALYAGKDLLPAHGVQPRHGLVQDQKLGPHGNYAGQRGAPFLPARKLERAKAPASARQAPPGPPPRARGILSHFRKAPCFWGRRLYP